MEIKDKLIVTGIRQNEIEQFLLMYFKSCSEVSKRKNIYGDKLFVTYSKKGIISSICDNGMNANELNLLIDEAHKTLLSPYSKIGKTILFSSYPVIGYYILNNNFLIRPVHEGSPLPNQAWAEHPFVFEFQYPSSSNWQIDIFRQQKEIKEYLYILNVIGRKDK